MFLFRVLALLSATVASALYSSHDPVLVLDQSSFHKTVSSNKGILMVQFFAPWCGHCKALRPEYTKAAQVLEGVATLAVVDADANKGIAGEFGVKGFPTIKMFGADKSNPTDYQQARDAPSMVQAVVQEAVSMVQTRLGGGHGSSSGASAVVTLTDENFEEQVLNSDDLWLVSFVAPWCGHCQKLAPEWNSAASELKERVKLGSLDATAHKLTGQKYKVEGFPTIKFFGSDKEHPESYNGGRTSSDIVTFCTDKVEANLPPPQVHELSQPTVWEEHCDGKTLCLVAFLPNLIDSGVSGRNSYIDILTNLTHKATLKKFGFLWSSVSKQPGLEAALNIGDFPALVVVSPKKNIYAQMRGSFSAKELSGFLGRVMKSREPTAKFDMPAIESYDPWDGKDEVVADQEEEFSLDDLMNEELDD
eukprot:TRINITY_DN12581_c0_g1_i1.p1 TRINITY_DN12581_c0_g1~~TRINITY_DN12581_c0_g1_i1.p1  ORF type:complete len:419 (+),score=90.92 TRINITY_DN12581_c0_g1_i1:62-1318(+)